ncbi:hypothetical protein ABL78_4437 [Leptomonas seymouri]|uniref:Uncharacterized protein n=1 Tax=Leptomonas seymouri TaxID=5684 RepID=A0A0N0P5X4_LEPSE|nr:hypothetical protein ABL78_4437 [Leptomonas seymouri]|eukprot:KPI86497.1 hypothetical protein ABL78_4437 [Leptomonas seymouri]
MNRFSAVVPSAVRSSGVLSAVWMPQRFAAAVADAHETVHSAQQKEESESAQHQENISGKEEGKAGAKSTALGVAADESVPKRRNIVVLSNTTKAVYIHPTNHIASWYWFITDFHKWFIGIVFLFVGTQVIARYRVAKLQTATQAQLGENLLDQRTRDLLSDIEVLRKKDPIRLEHEANVYHEQFWKRRAVAVAESRNEVRSLEIQRGKMQGEARGTDMTEWLGAKVKDDEEREVARRTQDYIQGFHQHLKSKRLI